MQSREKQNEIRETQDNIVYTHQNNREIDYANRKRNLEWKRNWFYFSRFRDDIRYDKLLLDALKYKKGLIRKQKLKANHLAAYGPAPAGAGTPWISIGPRNINGRVKSIAVHPTNATIIYAGAASGGVWKSADGGQSWYPLWDMQDTMAIGSLAIAPGAPDRV